MQTAYDEYDATTLDHIWAHQISCYNEILKDLGGNQYTAPHESLRARGQNNDTIVNLNIDVDAYNTAVSNVNNINNP